MPNETKSDLERIRDWIKGFDGIPEDFQIDFTHEIPGNAGLYPDGMIEVRRKSNINGDVTVTNQYNFGLYTVLPKPDDTDKMSASNAEWVMLFQRWVQEQSAKRMAPTFGNIDMENEVVKAQNGKYYGNKEAGVGVYMVTLAIIFKTFYGG